MLAAMAANRWHGHRPGGGVGPASPRGAGALGRAEIVAAVVVAATVSYTVYALVRGPGSHRAEPVATPSSSSPLTTGRAGAEATASGATTQIPTLPSSATATATTTTQATSPATSRRAQNAGRTPAVTRAAASTTRRPAGGSGSAVRSGTLAPGSAISLRATTACCTTRYVRHLGESVVTSVITSAGSGADRGDASWIVRAGLASASCVSFESADEPGRYLRHVNFRMHSQRPDGTALFRADATFCPTSGRSGTGTSFASYNYPSRYLRHFRDILYIAADGGSNSWDARDLWAADVSWRVTPALAA
jgi:non-reducing end alpha-L-arabinofuranosidase